MWFPTSATPPDDDASLTDVTVDTATTCDEVTVLQHFYCGASVLVTGATGFMGKVLAEKLMRATPSLDKLYLLMRAKKGKNVQQRLKEMTESPCFDRLRKEQPDFFLKLVAVEGDIGLKDLGISLQDRQLLAQQVTVVFHVAATVRFNEELGLAIKQNVRGTKAMLLLSRSFCRLKAFIHVSTAYSNCPEDTILESFFESPIECDKAIEMAECLDVEMMADLTPKLLGKWPNSYCYTKAVAEHVVQKYGQGLPIAVFRPAIVVCTCREPTPGWVDNFFGVSGSVVAISTGLLRTMHYDDQLPANMVPCDMAINAIIAAAWDVAEHWLPSHDVPIYNYVTSPSNQITWKAWVDAQFKHGWKYPPSRGLWVPTFVAARSQTQYLVYRLFLHLLPALVIDTAAWLSNNKSPNMLQTMSKLHKYVEVMGYFNNRQWYFEDKNVLGLWDKLRDKDRELFSFDMRALNWDGFVKDASMGVRKNLLKDDPSTLPAARRRMHRMYYLHIFTLTMLFALILWCLWINVYPALSAVATSVF